MEDNYEERLKKAQEKINEIDARRRIYHIVDNITFRKFKKVQLTVNLASMAIIGAIGGYNLHSYMNPNSFSKSSIYKTIDSECNLDNASDEIIINYMNSSLSQLNDYVSEGNINGSLDQLEAFRSSYYIPVMQSYEDYKETNDENYYKKFKKNVKDYEDRIVDYNENFSFDKSIYKYAKYFDGEVFVPYTGIVENSTIPSNAHIDNNIIYVPVNTLSKEEIRTLGND